MSSTPLPEPEDQTPQKLIAPVSRRGFLKGVGVAAAAAQTLLGRRITETAAKAQEIVTDGPVSGDVKIDLNLNGQTRTVTVEPRTTLLSALRDRLEPACTGPKLVCNVGTCGACTVLLDGKQVYSCSVLAVDSLGKKIETVEGLGTPDKMHPVQQAFVEKDAMMCGFCTSGFVTSVAAVLRNNPNPTVEQVKEGCKGNFCRCGTYPHVFAAALSAAKAGKTQ
jgi:xanthine dehydrogenase YagT iron-sulfur-binding subunit